ncbi:MAG: multidrug efflux pump subunit AcrB [Rhodothermales bacterium]|jgi:multidrug efflux pump subunit AcrB
MIRWFCKNDVAANLLMVVILIGGLVCASRVPLEIFPDFSLDMITVRVPVRGATPGEVEESVLIRIEEAIYDLQGIEQITASANEGMASIRVEVASGHDQRELLDEIKNRVDAINSFPDTIERPTYSLAIHQREVIAVVVAGDVGEQMLRQLGERVRDDLTAIPGITQVRLEPKRPYEIAIEISEQALDTYNLTFSDVANAVRSSSVDLSAGSIRAKGGDILVRTKGQAYVYADFASIVLRTNPDGTRITLEEVATVRDGFEEDSVSIGFDGKPAMIVEVFRVGDQSAIAIADKVKTYVADMQEQAPAGIEFNYWRDRSTVIKSRLATLARSATQGSVFVFILLFVFLRFSVALWVCIGIPVSFMGAFLLMPFTGVTINIISCFAFILVLGIVVDDAIVTGENIYRHVQAGGSSTLAAIHGTEQVAVPVTFGVLTTVAAFVPIAMLGGARGALFTQIPMIVIPVLVFSLIESKLILPSHLKHMQSGEPSNIVFRMQQGIARMLELFTEKCYQPVLQVVLHWRYTTLAFFVGAAVLLIILVPAGRMKFVFFPRVDSEVATASLVMPIGTPTEVTEKHVDRLRIAAEQLRAKHVDPDSGEAVIVHVQSQAGAGGRSRGPHLGSVSFEIVPPEDRKVKIRSSELVKEWRSLIGSIPGARELNFRAEIGRSRDPIDVKLSGQDFDAMAAVAAKLRDKLTEYPTVFDIADTYQDGKEEIQLKIRPEAEHLGITQRELARQVRQAFFGEEAQRIQRGRDDVRVMVRYPQAQRRSIGDLKNMRIRTTDGARIPFHEVADFAIGRGFSSITRVDRARTISVTADIDKQNTDMAGIKADLTTFLNEAIATQPGVRYKFGGEAEEQSDSMKSLGVGALFVIFVIYALLAIPFGSYLQPIIVMSVIPFGVAAAILGHLVLGLDLSLMSLFGILALTGVVVNDSLVMVDYINQHRREEGGLMKAVVSAGGRRFRPILLTSLTTFAGLMPLIFEKSTQVQFLIPMAVSLGFGILFTTFVTLLMVPVNYLILEDVFGKFRSMSEDDDEEEAESPT